MDRANEMGDLRRTSHHQKGYDVEKLIALCKISAINMVYKFILNQVKQWVGKQEWLLV